MTPSPRRRPHVRLAYAILTVPVAMAMALVLTPAQASTNSTTIAAFSSVHKLVPGSGLSAGPIVTLVKLKLAAGSYHVEMPVTVHQSNPDLVDYVDVSLVCKDDYGHADQLGQAVNTLHGTSFTLKPRLFITFTGTHRGVCVGYAYMGRIQGKASASASSRTISVTSASLLVTPDSGNARETVRYKGDSSANGHPLVGHSSRASKGVHFHAAAVNFNVDPTKDQSFAFTGNVFLTACTSPGGSRDASTNGRNLCQSVFKFVKAGPQLRTRLMVQEYAPDGTTVCRTVVVPNTTTTFHISANRHHLPISLDGSLTLPQTAGCGSHATAYTEVYVQSGPSVVVHFPSSVTSVLPG